MAGVEGQQGLVQGLRALVNEADAETKKAALSIGNQVGAKAVESIRHTIATTPSGITPGKPDRNWTGAMSRAADFKVRQRGNTTEVEWGWFNLRKATQYIVDQEHGGGRVATGMWSLYAAQQEVSATLNKRGFQVR